MDGLPSAGERFIKEQEAKKRMMDEVIARGTPQKTNPLVTAKRPPPQQTTQPAVAAQAVAVANKPLVAEKKKPEWSDDEILDC